MEIKPRTARTARQSFNLQKLSNVQMPSSDQGFFERAEVALSRLRCAVPQRWPLAPMLDDGIETRLGV